MRAHCLPIALAFLCLPAHAQPNQKWVTTWTASMHGPYPSGNASAQPDLRLAFPTPETGARDQTFRLIVQPDLWGGRIRLRFSNAFGTRPVTFEGVFAGLQWSAAAVVAGTNQPVRFGGKPGVTVAAGDSVWSDAVALPFVRTPVQAELAGRKLAVSFHIGASPQGGESGPMTWHAKALTTSYVTAPSAGSKGQSEDESAFPFSTTSWYFLDAVDVMAPAATRVVVAFGDSITDGTASTLNGDDRWPNALARRLHRVYGNRVVVVNAGIGGNQVIGPAEYSPQKPFAGGPAARQRLERDVLSLSGVSAVIWLEGINDFSRNADAEVEAVEAGMKDVAGRIRARLPGVKIIGATVISALGSSNAAHGSPAEDRKRQSLNEFIRTSGLFDGVADFDQATLDPKTGGLRPEFVPDSTTGGPGDRLHPNRAGYLAMAMAIDLNLLRP
ncbi:MAG TPA: GDSL-type esterase/lipase family protein [Candidatus Acidoferrales bacterium]|jgi:lysophospholipase L1-like esterase|nr:GDSL-type esterase/lipase family protein [Candidatus Acidoferrales bacterium]